MKLIIPCGGRSSRYPNMPPKWILPDRAGVPMVVRAVEKLGVRTEDLVITILREHEDRFNVCAGLDEAFGAPVTTLVLDRQTRSQSETVAVTLRALGISEPFLVKDSDNAFLIDTPEEEVNYVSVASLNDFEAINPRNKSYVTIDQENFITGIREKKVISDLFSVGGYFFRSPSDFLIAYEDLSNTMNSEIGEIYISEIISYLLMRGHVFKTKPVQEYQDWGTVHEWRRKLEGARQYFVSIDGFLFERGSTHFTPRFEDVTPNPEAVEAVRKLHQLGHQLVYLSIRPDSMEEMTRQALDAAGLPPGKLLMECDIGQWLMVTSPDATIPIATSDSLEVAVDDVNLTEKLLRSV